MYRLPGWMLLMGMVALLLVYVGGERVLLASPAERTKQGVEGDARWQAVRAAYMRQIEQVSEEIAEHEARLSRHLLEHPDSAQAMLLELHTLQEARAGIIVELLAAQAEYEPLKEMLHAGDFTPTDAVSLAIEQSPRLVEIDREVRLLEFRRAALAEVGGGREHPEAGQIDRQIASLMLARDEMFDRLARLHFNAAIEAAAQRVTLLAGQASALEPMLAEARVRYEDQARANADRAAIERRLMSAERRLAELRHRLQDAELEADLDAARH